MRVPRAQSTRSAQLSDSLWEEPGAQIPKKGGPCSRGSAPPIPALTERVQGTLIIMLSVSQLKAKPSAVTSHRRPQRVLTPKPWASDGRKWLLYPHIYLLPVYVLEYTLGPLTPTGTPDDSKNSFRARTEPPVRKHRASSSGWYWHPHVLSPWCSQKSRHVLCRLRSPPRELPGWGTINACYSGAWV